MKFKLEGFSAAQIELLRWTIQVASETVDIQAGDSIPTDTAVTLLDQMDILESLIVDQVHEAIDQSHGTSEGELLPTDGPHWEQLRLWQD